MRDSSNSDWDRRPILGGDGTPVGFEGNVVNLKRRKGDEESLRGSREMIRRLVESVGIVPWEATSDTGQIVYVGPQAVDLLGYPTEDWLKPGFWFRAIHRDDCNRVGVARAEALLTQGRFTCEYRMLSASGKICWVRELTGVHRGPEGTERLGGFLIDLTAAKSLDAKGEKAMCEIRELAHRNLNEREKERTEMARLIHDELGQSLTYFRIELAGLTGRFADRLPAEDFVLFLDEVAGMEEQLRATADSVRDVVTRLRPPVLDELGLSEALEWQAKEFSRRIGIRCVVKSNFRECASEVSTAVFRIFQEILTNVARHANASRVDVHLEQDESVLRLTVRDNGRGFVVKGAKQPAGFGLLGMRERAVAVGGSLHIESAPSVGTTIVLNLPFSASAQKQGDRDVRRFV